MDNVEEITIIEHIINENDNNYDDDNLNVDEEEELNKEEDDPEMEDITSLMNKKFIRQVQKEDSEEGSDEESDEEEEEKFENESDDSNDEFTPENSEDEYESGSESSENSDYDEAIQKIKRKRVEKIKFESLSEHYAYRFIHKLIKYLLEKESKMNEDEYIYKVYDEEKSNSTFYGLMNSDKLYLRTRLYEEVDISLIMYLFEALVDNNYLIFDKIREKIYESSLDDIDEKKICHIDWMKKISGETWLSFIQESNCLMGIDIIRLISDPKGEFLFEENENLNNVYVITEDMNFYTLSTLCDLSYEKVQSSRR